jgi:hypothetical protein
MSPVRAPFIEVHLHAAQRFTCIGAYDAPADRARSCAWRGRLIPRRLLCRHDRADDEQAEDNDDSWNAGNDWPSDRRNPLLRAAGLVRSQTL